MEKKFPKLGDAKLKEDVFIGPQIHEIINDDLSEHLMTETEIRMLTFRELCLNFLRNVKAENHKALVEDLLNVYLTARCNMSQKIHFLHSHLELFPSNLGTVRDEYEEGLHQDISTTEEMYAGKWSQNMLTD